MDRDSEVSMEESGPVEFTSRSHGAIMIYVKTCPLLQAQANLSSFAFRVSHITASSIHDHIAQLELCLELC